MDFDFCQVLYTAIDEIYSFRLRQEKILLLTQEISENSTIEVPGRPALKSTAPFQEEPITLVMARPARSSTIIKPGFKAAVALESYTASVLRGSQEKAQDFSPGMNPYTPRKPYIPSMHITF